MGLKKGKIHDLLLHTLPIAAELDGASKSLGLVGRECGELRRHRRAFHRVECGFIILEGDALIGNGRREVVAQEEVLPSET